jgi:hypothetical protein
VKNIAKPIDQHPTPGVIANPVRSIDRIGVLRLPGKALMIRGFPDIRKVWKLIGRVDCGHGTGISPLHGLPETAHIIICGRGVSEWYLPILDPLLKPQLIDWRKSGSIRACFGYTSEKVGIWSGRGRSRYLTRLGAATKQIPQASQSTNHGGLLIGR